LYPLFGVIVKVLLDPEATLTLPDGEIVPPAPAEAEMVYVVEVVDTKVAAMVLFAVTLEKVYELTVPTEEPLTVT
jgi:hypothetical protein